MRILNKKEGFTLVELLIVVAIIGILAAIAIPQFAQYRAKAYCSAAKSDLANYAIAQEAYFTDGNQYSTAVDSALPGFKPTQKVTLDGLSTAIAGFTLTATHTQCDQNNDTTPDIFTWDSTNGGMQQ